MFNDSEIYRVGDKQLDRIGRPSTLARWRVNGQGPCYAKLGGRIAYRGARFEQPGLMHRRFKHK